MVTQSRRSMPLFTLPIDTSSDRGTDLHDYSDCPLAALHGFLQKSHRSVPSRSCPVRTADPTRNERQIAMPRANMVESQVTAATERKTCQEAPQKQAALPSRLGIASDYMSNDHSKHGIVCSTDNALSSGSSALPISQCPANTCFRCCLNKNLL